MCFVITAIIILPWWDIRITALLKTESVKMMKYENGYLCMYSLLMPTSWRILSLQIIKHEIFTSVYSSTWFQDTKTQSWRRFCQLMLLFSRTMNKWQSGQVWLDLHSAAQEAESNFGSCTDAFQIRYDNVKTTQTASFCLLFIFWQHKRLHSLHVT